MRQESKVRSSKYVRWLKELKLHNERNGFGDSFSHLFGTYKLLKKWKQPKPVCIAGLFHNIYGTRYFERSGAITNRRKLWKTRLGRVAESLIFSFSRLDREKFLSRLGNGRLPRGRPRSQSLALLSLSLANDLDHRYIHHAKGRRHLRRLASAYSKCIPFLSQGQVVALKEAFRIKTEDP